MNSKELEQEIRDLQLELARVKKEENRANVEYIKFLDWTKNCVGTISTRIHLGYGYPKTFSIKVSHPPESLESVSLIDGVTYYPTEKTTYNFIPYSGPQFSSEIVFHKVEDLKKFLKVAQFSELQYDKWTYEILDTIKNNGGIGV